MTHLAILNTKEYFVEEPANIVYAMLLNKNSCRNPILIDQIIYICMLDFPLSGSFLLIQQGRSMLLFNKDPDRINQILNGFLIET